jgi:hypothetical protein
MSKQTFRTILAVLVALVVYTSYRYSEDITNTLSNINFSTMRLTSNRVVDEEVLGTGDDMTLTGDDMMLTGEADMIEEEIIDTEEMIEDDAMNTEE